jgi:uncharacterized membrane protein YqhA
MILVPIVGLGLAAAIFFVVGGISLIQLAIEVRLTYFGLSEAEDPHDPGTLIFEVVEHVHLFLVATVLYITAIGLYQLFIRAIDFHGWLQIDSTVGQCRGVATVIESVNLSSRSIGASTPMAI